ncbi:MAG TPA: ABC transporter substrate-binding protein [Anaerolineales bacterium]|nr:ABC transporter substrate-binding protein [Anaerolineales bacterium]
MRPSSSFHLVCAVTAVAAAISSCRAPSSLDLPLDFGGAAATTPSATAPVLPPEPSLLVVCLGQAPSSLYLYDALTPEAQTVLQAVYDGPFDILGYTYEPVILEDLPTPANGAARLEPITVSQESLYFNPESGLPDTLVPGKTYTPSGCTGPNCLQPYQGGDVSMDRWVVEFRLRSGLTWSDGESLTAADSVFSYRLNAQAEPPASRDLVFRTAGYEAVDSQTVRWTGIPGYFDPEIAAHFWPPLPEHLLAEIPVEDLPTAQASAVTPMGWGPYRIESRQESGSILLGRNASYHRASEGLPVYDEVLFRFVGNDPETVVQQLLTGECDVLDETALAEEAWPVLLDQEGQGRIRVVSAPGPQTLRADFIFRGAEAGAPSIFADAATRRALAMCVDRSGWVADQFGSHAVVPSSYLPASHPLTAVDLAGPAYDPQAAAAALEEAGWVDHDDDPATPRVAQDAAGVEDGRQLSWTLGVTSRGLDEAAARALAQDVAQCGAEVDLETFPAQDLFVPYPEGPAFGGDLDMVVWSWFGWVTPSCDLFASWEIPSDDRPEGVNASGFSDPAFDAACRSVLYGVGSEGLTAEAARETQRIFVDQMPALPLAGLPRTVALGPGVCGLEADSSSASLLWDLESLAPCAP